MADVSGYELTTPRTFLLLENSKKSNNLGPILRCAAAFAVTQVVAVGFDKCSTEGSHGASKHVPIIAFPTVEQANLYLRTAVEEGGCGCHRLVGMLVGVADAFSLTGYSVIADPITGLAQVCLDNSKKDALFTAKSLPVNSRPFQKGGNTCIVLSKLPRGLPLHLANVCDDFVHVPHVSILCDPVDGSLASSAILLDAQSCLSITLCHFAAWAKYSERMFEGHKFDVVKLEKGRIPDAMQACHAEKRKQAKQIQLEAAEGAIETDCWESDINNTADY